MLADADSCLLGLGSGIGLNSVVKLLGGRDAKPSSCLAEEIQLLVERLCSLLSLCHQAAWWPGDIRVVSSNRWRRGASSISFDPALVDLFDLTCGLAAPGPTSLEDHSPRQDVSQFSRHIVSSVFGHDTHVKTHCCGSHPFGPTVDRHSSVNSGARYA